MKIKNLFRQLHVGKIPALIYRVLLCFYIIFALTLGLQAPQTYINISLCVVFILYYIYKSYKNVYQIPFVFDIIFDVIFATLILYNYNQWDWFSGSFVYLMLLCINNVRHYFTRILLFSIGISVVLYVCFPEFSFKCLSPIILFCCFFWIEHYTSTLYQTRNALNNIIDDFFISSNNGKSYSIFREAIPLFQKRPFSTQINHIFCFRKKEDNDELYLVNGTKYLWSYRLLESNQNLNLLLNRTGFKHMKIELDGFDGNNHTCFIYRDNAIIYIYILLLKPNSALNLSFLKKLLLTQFFTRMSRIIESEYSINEKRIKGLQEIKQKMKYVNQATRTMHFIRNKLSPLKTYIAFMDKYSNSDVDQKKVIRPYLDQSFERVKKSMNMILSRANTMLEESDNPFLFSQIEKLGPQQLFSDIKLIWQFYDLDQTKIHVRISEKIEGQKKYIFYNISGFNLVLDNWISNIERYNDGFYEFNLIEQDQSFVLEFINNFKLGNDNKEFLHIIKIYNENNKAEITKKNYHGLNEIRDYLAQMDINSRLEHKDGKVYFTITLIKKTEIHDEENSNN